VNSAEKIAMLWDCLMYAKHMGKWDSLSENNLMPDHVARASVTMKTESKNWCYNIALMNFCGHVRHISIVECLLSRAI